MVPLDHSEQRGRSYGTAGLIVFSALISGGCQTCPATIRSETPSPSGEYVAGSYAYECGPVLPWNERIGLKARGSDSFDEIAVILEVPFNAQLKWVTPDRLRVVIDCRFETASSCLSEERRGVIKMRPAWRNVKLEYDVGDRLRGMGAVDILQQLASRR